MLTKEQLLKGLAGKTITHNLEGLGEVEIRSLSFADLQIIQTKELDGMDTAIEMIIYGLVTPTLVEEDITTLKNSNPRLLFNLATAITDLSGMGEDFLTSGGEAS